MKVRNDYVSNSSSSSFILADHEIFHHFNITKYDIMNALVEIYGRERHKNEVQRKREYMAAHPEYFEKKERKDGNVGPFWVYDMTDKKDRKEAISRWGSLLKGWDANNCHFVYEKGKGCIATGGENSIRYQSMIDNIAEIYGMHHWDLREHAVNPKEEVTRWVSSNKKDPKTGCYGHDEPADPTTVAFADRLRKDLGIMTNLEAIKCKAARFFIHADDNELCGDEISESGAKDKDYNKKTDKWEPGKAKWDTQSYTYDRVCEVLLDHLVKDGRINLTDPKFLEMMKIDEKYLSEWDKKHEQFYDFHNGKSFTWQDLKFNSLAWNLHEG